MTQTRTLTIRCQDPGLGGSGQGQKQITGWGWTQSGNDRYYIDPKDGTMAKGWKMIGEYWYYFDPSTGIMATGWVKPKNLWYYLNPGNGRMLINWQYIDNEWFYLETTNGDGQMVTGWKKEGDIWYFLFPTGTMAHDGWVNVDGEWYCFDGSGKMEYSKIITYQGDKYYVGEDGAMVVNTTGSQLTVTYEGVTYEVDEDGVCTAIGNNLEEKIEQWMKSVEKMGTWYADNIRTYQRSPKNKKGTGSRRNYYCPLINKEVGDDCSGMVSACLVLAGIAEYVGYFSENYNKLKVDLYSAGLGKRLESFGFVWHTFSTDYIPQRGDLLVQHNGCRHVEVVDYYNNNGSKTCYIWSWGKVYEKLPTTRTNWDASTALRN